MITEKDRELVQIKKLRDAIRVAEEALAKAEKYERLHENKDWQAYLQDIKVLIEQHDREILAAISMLPEAPSHPYMKGDESGRSVVVSSREDWLNYMVKHEIERDQLRRWLKEPALMISAAQFSREKLPFLKKELESMGTASNGDTPPRKEKSNG